jgi:hypothetical protein
LPGPNLDKAGPTDPRRRHRRAQYGELARTGPLDSRSAAGHTNGRRAANRVRPPLPSRSSSTGSSMSRRGRGLLPPAAYSAPLDRSMSRTCGSGCRLRGRGRSTPELRGCARQNIPPRRATSQTASGWAALALPANPRCEGQGNCRGLVQTGLGTSRWPHGIALAILPLPPASWGVDSI